jgi:hypothetical protein
LPANSSSVASNYKIAVAFEGSGNCVTASTNAAKAALEQYLNENDAQNVVVNAVCMEHRPPGRKRRLLAKKVSPYGTVELRQL